VALITGASSGLRAVGRRAAAIIGSPTGCSSATKVKETVEEHKWVQRQVLKTGVGSRGRLRDFG
jgi:hypothetical protein